jgi:fumarate hydratase, class II
VTTDTHTALYGHDTELALSNFNVSGRVVPLRIIHALARVKWAWAQVNAHHDTGVSSGVAHAIVDAARDVAAGLYDEQFTIDVFQTGSGTSTNMNVNEVIAHLATRRLGVPVHPNDHVNASQSTNDTFPTAIRIAALEAIGDTLLPGLTSLHGALRALGSQHVSTVKAGRTHLMDASPITFGQEVEAWAAQVSESMERIRASALRLARVPLGGTATGNGLNTPPGSVIECLSLLAGETDLALQLASSPMALQGGQDALGEMSGQVRAAALALHKIANDLRLLSSGPRTGLGELVLPELQPGSSIMPGKVNPVIPEVVTQVAAQVIGHDAAIAFAVSQGVLQLNTYLPVIAVNLLDAIEITGRASDALAKRCVARLDVDTERMRSYAERTPASAAGLNRVIGYDRAAAVVRRAIADDRTVRDVLLDDGDLTPEQIDAALDIDSQARGGRHRT